MSSDGFARRIVGWRASPTAHAGFVLSIRQTVSGKSGAVHLAAFPWT
ncbi:hypothetical protein [Agrobacterium tumefaciens]|nr:hypothetical protein [Agrobacterium tumefaciens]NSY46096.1 hypothetical protein [Agrobacterium tumefaciens]